MTLAFILSMPSNNSWNGKWSGDEACYAKVINIRSKAEAQKMIDAKSYRYSFGDGWVAMVSVKQVDRKEAAKLRRTTRGFCGYDWMIDSIRDKGEITL